MKQYQTTEYGSFIGDGKHIPADPGNRDYRQMQEEVANGDAEILYPTPEAPVPEDPTQVLKKAKENQRRYLKECRDYVKYSPMTVEGLGTFDVDPVSIQNILVTTQAFTSGVPVPEGFTWTSADNQEIPVTLVDMNTIVAMGFAQGALAHQTYNQMKAVVESKTTPKDVQDVKWPWPEGIDPRGNV